LHRAIGEVLPAVAGEQGAQAEVQLLVLRQVTDLLAEAAGLRQVVLEGQLQVGQVAVEERLLEDDQGGHIRLQEGQQPVHQGRRRGRGRRGVLVDVVDELAPGEAEVGGIEVGGHGIHYRAHSRREEAAADQTPNESRGRWPG
jgi:hypothetical protein